MISACRCLANEFCSRTREGTSWIVAAELTEAPGQYGFAMRHTEAEAAEWWFDLTNFVRVRRPVIRRQRKRDGQQRRRRAGGRGVQEGL